MPITPELASVLAALATARQKISAGKTADGLRWVEFAEQELAQLLELDPDEWRALVG